MEMQILMLVLFGGAGLGYFFWIKSKTAKMRADAGPAMRKFFETTGYRYAHMQGAPIEQHIDLALQAFTKPATDTTYVRDYQGVAVQHTYGSRTTDTGYSVWASWSAPLANPPKVLMQVADKSLSSVGKAVKEAFSDTTRQWRQEHPTKIDVGDPEIDGRFNVFGNNPNAIIAVLQTPGLKQALLACAEVDISVRAAEVVFNDPAQKNINAQIGGTAGSMAMGFDISKRMESTVPVHERVAQILSMLVKATQ